MSDLNLPDCKVIFSFQSDCKDLKNRETTFIDHDINFGGLLIHPTKNLD